jgi:class 3 adenylate cyclase/mannose-6-phosphate isomerase-like protein (cupin superfamily)
MARLMRKPFAKPDEVRPFENGHTDIYELDEMVIGRMVMEPGWEWARDVRPLAATERCEYHHVGVVLSGVLHVEMRDGTTADIGPNEAFEIPPGHLARVVGDDPWVSIDFRGARSYARPSTALGERILETILFTDIVDSTGTLERIGDAAWRDLLAEHDDRMRTEFDRYRGRPVHTTGDGFLALFDGAARAVQCAAAISASVRGIGLAIRAGVHTGEVEHVPGNVQGMAVHMAARIMSLAGPNEVLVSATTRALAEGSGLAFESRGLHALKGIPGERELFALLDA